MNETPKKHPFMLLAFALLMLVSNGIMIHSCSHEIITTACECRDFSKHSEHSDTHNLGDDLICSEIKLKSYNLLTDKDLYLIYNSNLKNQYNSQIWQPPKIS